MKTSKKTQKSPAKKIMPKKPVSAPMQKKTMPKIISERPPIQKESNFKIKPLSDRIVVKEDTESKEQKTASGIIIPISAQEDKGGKSGKVVAVGAGRSEEGMIIPVSVRVGDKVLFQWGDKIKVDDEEYYIVKESEILAIIK